MHRASAATTSADATSWRSRGRGASSHAASPSSSRTSSDSRGGRSRGGGRGRERTRQQQQQQQQLRSQSQPSDASTAHAAPVVGTCMQMCPRAEVLDRSRANEISRFEQPSTGPFTPADGDVFALAVKKYRRAAAGQLETNCTELRPPHVLLATLEHLFARVLLWPSSGFDWPDTDSSHSSSQAAATACTREQLAFLSLYHFVSDRVRSVRKDATVQRIEDATAIAVLEQSARFYILASLRAKQLLTHNAPHAGDWSETLNDQQLASALAQLHELYAKRVAAAAANTITKSTSSGSSSSSSSETWSAVASTSASEFVAYDILLHADDASAVSFLLRNVPQPTRTAAAVTRALVLFVAVQLRDVARFRRFFTVATALEKTLALRHAPMLWATGAAMLNKAFGKLDTFTLETLAQWLALPDTDAAYTLCRAMNLHVEHCASSTEDSTSSGSAIQPPPPPESWDSDDQPLARVPPAAATACAPTRVVRFKVATLHATIDDARRHELLAAAARHIYERDLVGCVGASDVVLHGD